MSSRSDRKRYLGSKQPLKVQRMSVFIGIHPTDGKAPVNEIEHTRLTLKTAADYATAMEHCRFAQAVAITITGEKNLYVVLRETMEPLDTAEPKGEA
jgi:hypothetical protein